MILPEELTHIGTILKPHGINGEISATLDPEIDPDRLRCIVLMMEGIPVPFFIEQWRTRGSEAVLLSIEGIDSEIEAKMICGKDVFAFKEDLPESEEDENGFYVADLIGWTLFADGNELGRIISFDDSTMNVLLIVENTDGKQLYIPVAEEFITDLNHKDKTIAMSLPEGLAEL